MARSPDDRCCTCVSTFVRFTAEVAEKCCRERRDEAHQIRRISAAGNAIELLRQLDRQLALWLGHFAPQFAQIVFDGGVLWILAEGDGEPAIGSGEIARRA